MGVRLVLGWDGEGGPHAEKAAFKAVSGNPPSSFVPPLQGSCLSREGDPWAWVASGHYDSWTPSYFNSFMKAAGSQGSTALSVPETAHQPIPTPRALLSAAWGQGFERCQHRSSAVFLGPHFLGSPPSFTPTPKGHFPTLQYVHFVVSLPYWQAGYCRFMMRWLSSCPQKCVCKDMIHGSTPILKKQYYSVCIKDRHLC